MMQSLEVPTVHHNYVRAGELFAAIVAQGEGRWSSPSPCAGWDARGVVEHVIEIHDNMLLAPMGAVASRPADDPVARWAATSSASVAAIESALADREGPTSVAELDLEGLLSAFTGELLIHSWDLAKAIGVDPHLDADLCAETLANMIAHDEHMRASGLFQAGVTVRSDADAASQLIAFAGRNPEWTPRPS